MSPTLLLNNRLLQIIFLGYSSLLIFLGRHRGMGIPNYDEAFYAQKAKEMLASGSFWIINYHEQPSFENPPFPIWAMTLAFKLFGVSDYSVALPSALFGVATVLLTYRFTEYLFNDRWTAFLAGVVLILPGFFVDYARRGMVDVPFTFFIASALFCFVIAEKDPRWYVPFGLLTALAVLTKSILGFFPLVIGFAYSIIAAPACSSPAPFRRVYFWIGVIIALVFGSSWYLVSFSQFDEYFARIHFDWLILHRAITGHDEVGIPPKHNPFFFLGYLKALWKNYWPWLPFATAGIALFGTRAFRKGDNKSLFIFLWIIIILAVMSAARIQALRYILAIFPALAILTAKTIGDWVSENRRETLIPYMVGMVMATVLFINATDIAVPQSVSLSQNSVPVRQLAPVIRRNAPDDTVGNYRLTPWNPRNAVIFYTDRFLSEPVQNAEELMLWIEALPNLTWLTTTDEFKKLDEALPGKFYLIAAYEKYAYFTPEQNRENIRYDFPGNGKEASHAK